MDEADNQPENRAATLCAEIMDFPVDTWGLMRQYMGGRDGGKACCTSRASNAMRRHFVVADLRGEQPAGSHEGKAEQLHMKQLRLDMWPRCHSLWVNLSRLPIATEVTQSQIEEIKEASEALPVLHSLHIIGRDCQWVPPAENSIEAVLMDLLARHASVVTLKYINMRVPFNLPILQHLVLEFKPFHTSNGAQDYGPAYNNPFAAISKLENLKTLYVHYHRYRLPKGFFASPRKRHTLGGAADLTGCVHLQHVTLRDVTYQGKLVLTACMRLQQVTLQDVAFRGELALPIGRPVQIMSERTFLNDNIGTLAEHVTMLSLHSMSVEDLQCWGGILGNNWLFQYAPANMLQNLKRLRVNLRKEDFAAEFTRGEKEVLYMIVEDVPSLEDFELEMQCNLSILMGLGHALTSLVIIASGTLEIRGTEKMPPSKYTYFQSGGASLPCFKLAAKAPFEREIWTGVRLDDHIKERQDDCADSHHLPAKQPETVLLRRMSCMPGACWCAYPV